MKKIVALMISIVTFLCVCSFVACDNGVKVEKGEKTVVLIVDYQDETKENERYDVTLEGYYLINLMETAGEQGFSFSGSYDRYGLFLKTVGDVTLEAPNYWFIYTDSADYSNAEWGTYNLNGVTLGSATLGASSLPLQNGCTYVITVGSYSW